MIEYITAIRTKDGKKNKIDYLSLANKPSFDLVASYRKAGAYTWTCPKDGEYIVLIVGGGGSGCVTGDTGIQENDGEYTVITGGKHGDFTIVRSTLTANTTKHLVVGAGGEAVSYVGYNQGTKIGNSGGTSSFDGITAEGGFSGAIGRVSFEELQKWHKYSDRMLGWVGLNIFLDENGKPVTNLCDGGDAIYYNYGSEWTLSYLTSLNDKILSPGVMIARGTVYEATATTPTDCGAGSGGVRGYIDAAQRNWNLQGAPGADGGVFIYKVR